MRPMKLPDLLQHEPGIDPALAAVEVTGISADSRSVRAGDVFFAVSGTKDDGLRFLPDALAAGAVAVGSERLPDPPLPHSVAVVRGADVRDRKTVVQG